MTKTPNRPRLASGSSCCQPQNVSFKRLQQGNNGIHTTALDAAQLILQPISPRGRITMARCGACLPSIQKMSFTSPHAPTNRSTRWHTLGIPTPRAAPSSISGISLSNSGPECDPVIAIRTGWNSSGPFAPVAALISFSHALKISGSHRAPVHHDAIGQLRQHQLRGILP